ncbi:Nucleotide-binding universal stress protein, UspA family [Desulfomicrobium apsheronum]|uniref:Nucleotide-binding universal stress protein, UspA family n=1 Tax=Desulfomicrobium apsheronum TaxID=52560 RepID=A0A1I3W8Q5_9BACT|nr:universal stress protein [Desulfomicrobium apsheronum]SFK03057.1 Nucleotide-binding universal stress protein, UspA family [Desulfomicrobium apsheronum]
MLPEYKRILYATDLSESARMALRHAISLANCHGAAMTILHVVPDLVELMSGDAGFDIESHFSRAEWETINATATTRAKKKARERVREMTAECATDNPRCPVSGAELKIQTRDPAERLLAEIQTGNYDLVVMGAHGRGAFMDMLLGSVANKVVRLSSVPVLTVRLPVESAAG